MFVVSGMYYSMIESSLGVVFQDLIWIRRQQHQQAYLIVRNFPGELKNVLFAGLINFITCFAIFQ